MRLLFELIFATMFFLGFGLLGIIPWAIVRFIGGMACSFFAGVFKGLGRG